MRDSAGPDSSRRPNRAPLIVALALVTYVNSLQNELVFDDRGVVIDNPVVRRLDLKGIFTHGFWGRPKADPAHTGSYRPLTTLTYALNYAAGELRPQGYHLVNILLHALCSFLAYLVAGRLLQSEGSALAAAALFATHPIHTEAVANVAGRAEMLAGVFFFAALLLYLRYREERRPTVLLWTLVAYLAAILSKESAIALPAVIIVMDWLLPTEGRADTGGEKTAWHKAVLPACVGMAAVAGLYLFARYLVLGQLTRVPFTEVENPMAFAPALPRWLTRLYLLTVYLRLLVWPASLSADYSFNQIPLVQSLGDLRNLVTLTASLAGLVLLVWSHRRARVLCFALLFAAVTFSLAANLIIPIGTVVGERLLYVPCFGFCVAVAWAAAEAAGTWKHPRARSVMRYALIILTALYAVRSVARNADWRTDLELMESAVRVSPNSVKVQANLGHLYAEAGNFEAAERHYRKAIAIRPDHVTALSGLCLVLGRQARVKEMMAVYEVLSESGHKDADKPFRCGLALQTAGQFKEAIGIYEEALEIDPDHPEAGLNMGYCREQSGDTDGAVRAYQEAARRNPTDPRPTYNLVLLCLKEGRLRDGERALLAAPESVQRRPELLKARYNLAVRFIESKDLGRAADHFEFILRHNPQFPNAAQMHSDLLRWREEGH